MTAGRPSADGETPARLLALAVAAATAAARLLAAEGGKPRVVSTKSSPTDVVTEMDRSSERLIREYLLAQRPGDAILGEEGGQSGDGARVRWIVDPLDGTVNYLYGLPDWAVSIGCEVAGTVVAGVVAIPGRHSLYTATAGGGAWRDWLDAGHAGMPGGGQGSAGRGAERISCLAEVPLERALIATGFGYQPGRRRVQGRVVAELLPRVRDIRRNGACAVDLCTVASGQVDGYYERGVQYWDIAAGTLIAREAGAVVAGLAGRPPGPSMTIAGGPVLFGQLHDALLSLDPERDD